MEEMGKQMDAGTPYQALWENISIGELPIQSCGCSMGLAALGEQALWLGLSVIEKVDFLECSG